MKNRGFTLVEMEMSMIIAAIMVLMIGVLAEISIQVDINKRRTAQIYYDLDYAVRMAENKARPSSVLKIATSQGSWVLGTVLSGETSMPLLIDSGAIGLLNSAQSKRQLIYMPTYKTSPSTDPAVDPRDVLMEMPTSDSYNFLNFSHDCLTSSCNKVKITLSGEREMNNNVSSSQRYHNPFSITFTVTRRPI